MTRGISNDVFTRAGTEVTISYIDSDALLTLGEVLVSATGLEFAYSQAPPSMKGAIMSFWNLAVTIGNLWVLLADTTIKQPAVLSQVASTGLSPTAFLMFFFAGFALITALAFRAFARRYVAVDNYRGATAA